MNDKKIGFYLERTTRIVKLAFHQAIAELGYELTPEQWVIMDYLSIENGQSQVELASKSYKNAPTISRILDVLARKGYIERRKYDTDKRKHQVYLTDIGVEVVEAIRPHADRLRVKGWQDLSDEDYESFIRILNRIFSNFE